MTEASPFLRALEARVLLGDGGLGVRLGGATDSAARPLPELNLTSPESVLRIHREDVEAGADLLVTNTFLACRSRLESFGLEGRIREIHREAVRLAREAGGRRRFVAGSIGPGGGAEGVREQADLLAEAGCDVLILETFTQGAELLEACRVAVATGRPVSAQMAAADPEALEAAGEAGAAILGVNCLGPDEAIAAVERVRPGAARLAAWPSAGRPARVGEKSVYPVRPDAFAAAIGRLAEQGVRLLGGCCGVGAAHLRAAAARLGTP